MALSTKAGLRAEARRILAEMPEPARLVASAEICRRLEELPEWTNAKVVGVYSAQALEPDLTRLIRKGGKMFCFPRVAGDGLEFHRCDSLDLLQPGPWNLLEPGGENCPIVPPFDLDMMIIPGLAFTRTGARIGRGRGFYDRFLARIHPRAVKVGVCFHSQVVEAAPIEAHDHVIDMLVNELELTRRAQS